MLNTTRSALLSTLLLAAALVPTDVFGSVQHTSIPLDKGSAAVDDGSECYKDFATDPTCAIVNVAFFEDTECNKPLELVRRTSRAMIKGNEQMNWDGSVAHSLQHPFGSLRVLAATKGLGIGFAKEEESDTVVQNTAWMSADQVWDAFQTKDCITFPNLDSRAVGVWTARRQDIMNQGGYVWNPDNVPIQVCGACTKFSNNAVNNAVEKRHTRSHQHSRNRSRAVCLEPASYGAGGVLLMYNSSECTGPTTKQLYSSVQCTPLSTTNFKSYKAIAPSGPTIDTIFSPVYYDLNANQYHACAQHDVDARPFQYNKCQKMDNEDVFVGVYGVDPDHPQDGPAKGDKVLKQGHGGLLLAPNPNTGGKGH